MENSRSKTVYESDRDYSLDDLFDDEWKTTENNEKNMEIQGVSSSRVTENQNSDRDYSLNDYFTEEWTYDSTNKNQLFNFQLADEFMKCIEFLDTLLFRELLNSNLKFALLNEKCQTVLHLLFYKRAWELFELYDKTHSHSNSFDNTNFTDDEGLTHLHVVCARGSLSLVERFLCNSDNVNASYHGDYLDNLYSGFTALHFAVTNPKTSDKKVIIKKLIERGANVNATDSKGRTPLHIASQIFDYQGDGKINLEIMDILLRGQSDIDARDANGNTPLLSVFSLLYQEFRVPELSSCLDYLDYLDFDEPHISLYMPEVKEKLSFYLQHGADVTATNKKNTNILHLVLMNLKTYRYQFENKNFIFDDNDHLDMINNIFSANPKINVDLKSNNGETPLQMAVACMSLRIIELLLDHGADLKILTFEVKREKFFYYPNLVVIFEPIQDLINVLNLLLSRGFNLSLQDNIEILKFLVHDGEGCDCDSNTCTYKNIKLVLHYGSKEHAESIMRDLNHTLDLYEYPGDPDFLDVYADERLQGTAELYLDLMEYFDTTQIGNIHSDEEIKKIVQETIQYILSERFILNVKYKLNIKKDLNTLKSIKFENNVSLHDVLLKDPLDTPRSILNEFDLKQIEKLHCYKDAVKGHITKARVRCLFEKYSSDYLKLISDTLPDVCCRMIVRHLSNEEILNLCLATTIDN